MRIFAPSKRLKTERLCPRYSNISIFYFYSNEQEPIHVHVLHGGKESIFDLIMMNGELDEIRVREKHGADPLPEKDKHTAEAFIRKYHKNIIDKWVKFFVLKQSVRSTNIKKKL